jgi:hypothetical protein
MNPIQVESISCNIIFKDSKGGEHALDATELDLLIAKAGDETDDLHWLSKFRDLFQSRFSIPISITDAMNLTYAVGDAMEELKKTPSYRRASLTSTESTPSDLGQSSY